MQELLQRLAGGARDQHAQDVEAAMVQPRLARLMDQRQAAEARHPLIGRLRGRVRSGCESRLGHRLLDRVAAGGRHHAKRVDMRLAPPADQRDETGHVAALDIASHNVAHAAGPRRGESSRAHYLFPPSCLVEIRHPAPSRTPLAGHAAHARRLPSPASGRAGWAVRAQRREANPHGVGVRAAPS